MNLEPFYSSLAKFFRKNYRKAFFLYIAFGRKRFTTKFLDDRMKYMKEKPLDAAQRHAIKNNWRGCKVDKRWFQFYNWTQVEKNTFEVNYVPDDLFYCFVYDHYNNTEELKAIDDKNYYDLYFPDVKQPRTIIHIIEGQCLDKDYKPVDYETAVKMCVECGEIISKPSVYTGGGKKIHFWDKTQDVVVLEGLILEGENAIIQEVVHQHPSLDILHKGSINTIRIMTWYHDGIVEVLSTIVRMGVGDSHLDNISQGGYYCGVNDDGSLKKWGYTNYGEPKLFHPQGAVFAECTIPSIDECKELVKRIAYRFIRVSKLASWDLSIDTEGNPILIEANLSYGALDLHQVANGPIFGDMGRDIVLEILRQKKYRRFNRIVK